VTTAAIKPTKKEAFGELWRRGLLKWKLDPIQKQMYDLYYKDSSSLSTWLLARRSGKTFCLAILAIEQCIRKPNSIVKFVAPTKAQVNSNTRPLFKKILDDCPDDIKPEFRTNDFIYYFPNGSEIQLAGSDSGHAEKLRGADSHLCIVDEAGSCDELSNLVKSILLPTTLITRGKIILASTPPKDSDHEFLSFIETCEHRGTLVKKTIYDNPRITQEDIERMIIESGGKNSPDFRRECLCEIIKDPKSSVLPEFTSTLASKIITESPRPPMFDTYVGMDLGGKDLTVVLFAYFDFRRDKVIVEDEIVIDFQEINNHIKTLVDQIEKKEGDLWLNRLTNEVNTPKVRVSDINYIVLKDISVHSKGKITFTATKKDEKRTAVNNLRIMLANEKILIDPRCKTLIRHLNNVKWSKSKKNEFARSPDDGHYDAVDALIYLIRSINYTKNPYPPGYGLNMSDLYISNEKKFKERNSSSTVDVYRSIFGKRK
jgi:hypothetical protein